MHLDTERSETDPAGVFACPTAAVGSKGLSRHCPETGEADPTRRWLSNRACAKIGPSGCVPQAVWPVQTSCSNALVVSVSCAADSFSYSSRSFLRQARRRSKKARRLLEHSRYSSGLSFRPRNSTQVCEVSAAHTFEFTDRCRDGLSPSAEFDLSIRACHNFKKPGRKAWQRKSIPGFRPQGSSSPFEPSLIASKLYW